MTVTRAARGLKLVYASAALAARAGGGPSLSSTRSKIFRFGGITGIRVSDSHGTNSESRVISSSSQSEARLHFPFSLGLGLGGSKLRRGGLDASGHDDS